MIKGTSKNSFSMKSARAHRISSSFELLNTSRIHQPSFLLLLDFARFHGRKAIFRAALNRFVLGIAVGMVALISSCSSSQSTAGLSSVLISSSITIPASSTILASSSSLNNVGSSSSLSSGSISLNPNVAPGGNFDLSLWELQEPIGTTGSPNTVLASGLIGAAGFQDAYFYTAADGGMAFYCPVKGVVTTGNSSYARSELREMNVDGTQANWSIAGSNILSATLKVVHVPDHVTVGQIHIGKALPGQTGTSTLPICELFYGSNGDIKLGLESSATGSMGSFTSMSVIASVPNNQVFSYTMQLKGDGTLTITIFDGTSNRVVTKSVDTSFFAYGQYFKAGDYDQTKPNDSTYLNDAATVEFYALSVTHN